MFWVGVVTGIACVVGCGLLIIWWEDNGIGHEIEKLFNKEEAMPESSAVADMKLSEAITKGISMRPKRAHGVYFAGDDRSDVLGAAYQGATGNAEVHNYQVADYLEKNFPILKKKVSNPETGEIKTLKTVIRQLNDQHQWKRKNVARFVKSVEDRTTVAH
jgi:hypothetical protein